MITGGLTKANARCVAPFEVRIVALHAVFLALHGYHLALPARWDDSEIRLKA
jgi:hypothetical protein